MKIIALILAVFVAFPNLGYSLASNCCSHEKIEHIECGEDIPSSNQDQSEEGDTCPSQCDCSCCQGTFLIKDESKSVEKLKTSFFIKTEPLNQGTAFALGFIGLIWQPPKIS